ncbi:MAG: flagellar motor switch protein FliG [Dehalococcoidia bacterium]|nr:MAG: flagellar motor switch protein FliG [Dehalococcoidia bacterium]
MAKPPPAADHVNELRATGRRRLTGRQKAAALLIALGPTLSSQLLKLFSDERLEIAIAEVFRLERLDMETRLEVLEEAFETAMAEDYLTTGGLDYAREILQRALGPQKTSEILDRITGRRTNPFDFVREIDPSQVMSFLQGEHPQTIALVVAHLPATAAAQVIAHLDPELQGEVASRIAAMNRTAPEVVEAVEKSLKRKLSAVTSQEFSNVGGLDYLVRVLNQVDRATEKSILSSLDPTLAEEVRKRMFVFEDIAKLDDRSIQRILREVNSRDLVLAMRGCTDDVQRRILSNMSSRAAQTLKDDLEALGPVRLKNVEEAQQNIVRVIRRLDEAEEIVISRGNSRDEVLI